MKKLFLLPILTTLVLSAVPNGFASEGCHSLNKALIQRPHRIYFGPEFLSFQIDTKVRDVHVEGRRFFWGIRFGYEYLKPEAFYAAAELFATNANRNFSMSNQTLTFDGRQGAGFGSVQSRFGYTLSKKEHLITPYVGIGMYSLSKKGCHGFKEGSGYLSGGFRTQSQLTSTVLFGVNAEIFRPFGIRETAKFENKKVTKYAHGWGLNIGAPITFCLSSNWDLKVTPYFLKLVSSETQNIYGTSLLVGFRF